MSLNQKMFLSFFIINLLLPKAYAEKEETSSSSELGIMVAYYYYAEPNFMNQRAANIGADYIGTFALDSSWFLRGDIRGFYGKVKYRSEGTGEMDNQPTWYIEPRALFGKNLVHNNFILAPFTGIGYRHLYNDMRGFSTTNHLGYRRDSNYLYIPFGIIHKLHLTEKSKLITTAEFDYLFWGKQISYMSDIYSRNSDIINKQTFGIGVRLNIMYRYNNWSIGPFINYWHVDASDTIPVIIIDEVGNPIGKGSFIEPKNYTIEAGLKISYRF